ncbi:MAG: flavin reductase family protein [Lachnospiraceae bacterium]|jgi:flavin reductase (DIM6/NTAB) family NADH-FMN oxidoreductase RutF|uniref:flavin reductase family protein n=1 Tax=Ileibacterium valens TaxID=1862668 RepID=UPI00257351DA|nr:flavin reductase family protein [Ileibacterium valens]MCI9516841.1 flavin reductase family protein [Lachnospiraceae bacterium]MCI9661351.1 flavin reductase family protein [Lachnospiraceae bacterium]
MNFKEMKPEELQKNPFTMIGKEWLLVTAEKDGKANTMTASWGGMGVMWGKNTAFIVLRPQRYTKEFIDSTETFSLSVLDESFRKTYGYLGSVSGRDEDKIAKSGLTIIHEGATPYFEEASTVLICRKLYAQEYQPECFLDVSAEQKWYPDKDYHTMYIAEIEKVLIKE